MTDNIIVAIITGLFTSIPVIVINYRNSSKTNALIEHRLNNIEKDQKDSKDNISRLREFMGDAKGKHQLFGERFESNEKEHERIWKAIEQQKGVHL